MEDLESRLIRELWVNPNQFIKAKEEQKRTKKSVYANLIKLGFLTEEDIFMFFSQYTHIPYVRISEYKLKEELMNLFPEQIYREHLFIPLFKIDDSLYIAIANPLDTDLINTLSIQSNLDIHPLFSSPSAILEVINRFFGPDDKYFNIQDLIVSPQAIQRLPFWRESERVKVNLPIEFKPQDDRVLLVSSAYIPATCSDISMSGKAMGIKTFLFLPPQTELLIRFPSIDSQYQAKGEVVHCNMEERVRYFLGVKFLEMREDIIRKILEEGKGLDIKL